MWLIRRIISPKRLSYKLDLACRYQNPSENYDCDNLDFSIESLISDLEQHLLKC